MRLSEALRLGEAPRLALVGAGGKTSALFQLGFEYKEAARLRSDSTQTVILMATTHLASHQLKYADNHVFIRNHADFEGVVKNLPTGTLLLTGSMGQDNRTKGLTGEILNAVQKLAQSRNLPLFIEADGARQRPLKAPATHEPVIPGWVDEVVVVAGMSGVGKPLRPKWVHRPGFFAALSGLQSGDEITTGSVAVVLKHPEGGLRNIPSTARRTVLLNQASTPKIQAAGYRLAEELLSDYHAVVIANLTLVQNADANLFEDVSRSQVLAVHEPVAGIILAAGESTRFGQPKQVINWRGMPLVRHVALCALGAGFSPVMVISGDAADQVEAALVDLPVSVVHNPDWSLGQSASIKAGMDALPAQIAAVLFILVDQPFVSRRLMRALVESHAESLAPVIGPLIDGRRGNPVLFDRSTFSDLHKLSGDIGGRAIFSRYPVRWLEWYDQTAGIDIDTPQDYEELRLLSEIGAHSVNKAYK
jgi:molybdenum cofactor cytidylyltransferase